MSKGKYIPRKNLAKVLTQKIIKENHHVVSKCVR